MPRQAVTGTGVHYTVEGSGKGLVLVHGASMDAASNYAHLFQHFTSERTVIALDYAGSGHTALPHGELTVDLLTDQVTDVINEATAGPVDLVGFSLGAALAARVAARKPDRVERLVLVAGFSDMSDPRLRLGLKTWGRVLDVDEDLVTATAPMMAFSPAFLSSLGDQGLAELRAGPAAPGTRRQIAATLQVDIRAELPRITAPTLVVGCSLDYLVPVEHVRDLHRAIPGSRYVELDSGHVVFAEKPAEIATLLREFLLGGPSVNSNRSSFEPRNSGRSTTRCSSKEALG
jgi:pimeloyl-ACP methyl ester carboxylesterase